MLLLLMSGDASGFKRAKNIVDTKRLSYEQMKRVKNYFDNYEGDGNDMEFKLNGGDLMKSWVNNTLGNARDAIENVKRVEMNAGKENAFIRTHNKDRDNKNITKVNLPKPEKGSQYDNIMNGRVRYESVESKINSIKYLIEYMNNDNKKIL